MRFPDRIHDRTGVLARCMPGDCGFRSVALAFGENGAERAGRCVWPGGLLPPREFAESGHGRRACFTVTTARYVQAYFRSRGGKEGTTCGSGLDRVMNGEWRSGEIPSLLYLSVHNISQSHFPPSPCSIKFVTASSTCRWPTLWEELYQAHLPARWPLRCLHFIVRRPRETGMLAPQLQALTSPPTPSDLSSSCEPSI